MLAYNNKQHPAAYQAASFGTQALRRDKQRINTDSDTYSRTTSSHTTKAALPCQANQQNNQGCKVFRATTCGGQRCSIYLSLLLSYYWHCCYGCWCASNSTTANISRSPRTGMTIAVFSPVNTTATDNSPFVAAARCISCFNATEANVFR